MAESRFSAVAGQLSAAMTHPPPRTVPQLSLPRLHTLRPAIKLSLYGDFNVCHQTHLL